MKRYNTDFCQSIQTAVDNTKEELQKQKQVYIRALLSPGARQTTIKAVVEQDNELLWRISVTAPAVDNKANIMLLDYISTVFGASVIIISGHTHRLKLIAVRMQNTKV